MNTNERFQIIFAPHPPVLIPEIGNGQEYKAEKTLQGMGKIADLVKAYSPETIIYLTPHGNSFNNGTCILYEQELEGDFKDFGHKNLGFKKSMDIDLINEIGVFLDEEDLVNVLLDKPLAKQYGVTIKLDHGVMVPMHFIDQKYSDYKIVHISPGFTSLIEQYKIGMAIRKAIKKLNRKVLVVASGDLSHCLKEEGPYSYHPMGQVFDDFIVECVSNFDGNRLVTISPTIFEPAGQCGLRSFCIAFGMLDGYKGSGEVYSYEGPFGVGYLTGSISQQEAISHSILDDIQISVKKTFENKKSAEDDYIRLARKTIEYYVATNRRLELLEFEQEFSDTFLDIAQSQKAGVFVSIHKAGNLRGCIGTIAPTKDTIADEIIDNAIQASSADPRFDPIDESELEELDIKVDILSEIEPICSENELDVTRYGVIVEQGRKRGLLLPNLEGINTVKEQIEIAKKKANINGNQNIALFRFEVIRHELS